MNGKKDDRFVFIAITIYHYLAPILSLITIQINRDFPFRHCLTCDMCMTISRSFTLLAFTATIATKFVSLLPSATNAYFYFYFNLRGHCLLVSGAFRAYIKFAIGFCSCSPITVNDIIFI
jgi:hypothetical protein